MLQKALEQFLYPETRLLLDELQASTGSRFRKLNEAISQLIDDWSMISFTPLDYSEEDSIAYVLSQVRHLLGRYATFGRLTPASAGPPLACLTRSAKVVDIGGKNVCLVAQQTCCLLGVRCGAEGC